MKAPRNARLLVDKNGAIMDGYDAAKASLDFVKRRRREFARTYPERTPITVHTYVLKTNEIREVIRLAEKKRKP